MSELIIVAIAGTATGFSMGYLCGHINGFCAGAKDAKKTCEDMLQCISEAFAQTKEEEKNE